MSGGGGGAAVAAAPLVEVDAWCAHFSAASGPCLAFDPRENVLIVGAVALVRGVRGGAAGDGGPAQVKDNTRVGAVEAPSTDWR